MKTVLFSIVVGECDIDVEVEVNTKEYKLLKKYAQLIEDINNGDNDEDEYPEFENIEELSGLYNRVIDIALDELANASCDSPFPELEGEMYDFEKSREYIKENYSMTIDFPSIDDLKDK